MPPEMNAPKCDEAVIIVCDDIRNELGAKSSYMGVYGGGILVPKFPALLPAIAFGLIIVNLQQKITWVKAQLLNPDGEVISDIIDQKLAIEAVKKADRPRSCTISLRVAPARFGSPGNYLFRIVFNKKEELGFARTISVRTGEF